MENVSGSQTETVQDEVVETHDNAVQDALEAFGISAPQKEETPQGDEPPAIEEEKPADTKKIRVKFNKEDVDIDEAQVPELLQKGLALEKERERKSEYQTALDRAAKIAGYDNHEEFMKNLDALEQASTKAKEDEYTHMRNNLLDELEDNGIDRKKAEQFIENHPLMRQAREAIEIKQKLEQETQKQTVEQQWASKWQELYDTFPDTKESSVLFLEGSRPEWFTPDMEAKVNQGYHPLDAYKLAHMDKLQSQTKKQAEQKMIKEQRLGTRAQVVTDSKGTTEQDVPVELASAFSLFGLKPSAAKKYVK